MIAKTSGYICLGWLLALGTSAPLYGQQSTDLFTANFSLADGSKLSVARLSAVDAPVQTSRLTVTSPTGVVSSLLSTLAPGEYVEYLFETVAQTQSLDLSSQCPDAATSVIAGKVRWSWTFGKSDTFVISSEGATTSVIQRCSDSDSSTYCVTSVPELSDTNDLAELLPVINDDYTPGLCFPDAAVSGVGNGAGAEDDFASSSRSTEPPPEISTQTILTTEECKVLVASACKQPLITNQNLVIFYNKPGEDTRDNERSSIGQARRALSRALKSGDNERIRATIRSVLVSLRSTVTATIVSDARHNRIVSARKSLRDRTNDLSTRVRRAIRILKRAEIGK